MKKLTKTVEILDKFVMEAIGSGYTIEMPGIKPIQYVAQFHAIDCWNDGFELPVSKDFVEEYRNRKHPKIKLEITFID